MIDELTAQKAQIAEKTEQIERLNQEIKDREGTIDEEAQNKLEEMRNILTEKEEELKNLRAKLENVETEKGQMQERLREAERVNYLYNYHSFFYKIF